MLNVEAMCQRKLLENTQIYQNSKCYSDNMDIYFSPYQQSISEKQCGHSTLFSVMPKLKTL